MADPNQSWKVQVNKNLEGEEKFERFVAMTKAHYKDLERVEEIIGLGLIVKLWLYVMRADDRGVFPRWAPEDVARAAGWRGPAPEAIVKALLECGQNSVYKDAPGFIEKGETGYSIHDWAEWQNDPAGKREKRRVAKAEYRAEKKGATATPGTPSEGKPEIGPKEECVRQILKAMKTAHTPGGSQQKAEYARAWIERPGIGGAKVLEVLMHPDSRGQNVFWLDTQLGGKPFTIPKGVTHPPSGIEGKVADWANKAFGGGGK